VSRHIGFARGDEIGLEQDIRAALGLQPAAQTPHP
jgi:hypothetical protein